MNGYETWMGGGGKGGVLFNSLRYLVLKNRLSFNEIDLFYVGIYTYLLVRFISKFKQNILIIALLFLSINYVFYTTQIRYFFAYFFVLHALYSFYVEEKKWKSFLLFSIGLTSHASVILFIPLYFLAKVEVKKLEIKILLIALVAEIIFIIFYSQIQNFISIYLSQYQSYIQTGSFSSLLGGSFSLLPSIIIILLLSRYFKKSGLLDKKSIFLYKMSVFPFLYIGLAFGIQIIGHRLIITALLSQLLLTGRIILSKSKKVRIKHYIISSAIMACYIFYFYFMPFLLFGKSQLWTDFENIITSIHF